MEGWVCQGLSRVREREREEEEGESVALEASEPTVLRVNSQPVTASSWLSAPRWCASPEPRGRSAEPWPCPSTRKPAQVLRLWELQLSHL